MHTALPTHRWGVGVTETVTQRRWLLRAAMADAAILQDIR